MRQSPQLGFAHKVVYKYPHYVQLDFLHIKSVTGCASLQPERSNLMAVYLVTYDLNKEGKSKVDYNKFYAIRDKYDHVKLSESSYAFNTTESPIALKNTLRAVIDPNDHIYIITLKKPYAGFGPKSVNDWLEKNLPGS
jgi:hypothetical protein